VFLTVQEVINITAGSTAITNMNTKAMGTMVAACGKNPYVSVCKKR